MGTVVLGRSTHAARARRTSWRIHDGAGDRASWERADIAAGLPQVYTATSEAFVAQMLNLDLLGAIAFDKGCYTGQEVIARAHYRGRVKRRLQRWHATAGTAPRAGDSARTSDGRALTVVRAAQGLDGGWDLLAVGTFAAGVAPESTAPTQPDALDSGGPAAAALFIARIGHRRAG